MHLPRAHLHYLKYIQLRLYLLWIVWVMLELRKCFQGIWNVPWSLLKQKV